MNPLQETNDEQLLSRYLLEDLGEAERERLEKSYLSDDDLFVKLLVAEDELIAAYVQGELSRSDRAKFERAYLTNPHKRRKVEATRELLSSLAGTTPPAPGLIASLLQRLEGDGWWKPVYAVAGLLLFAICCALLSWLLIDRRRMQSELNAAREQLRYAESERRRATPPTPTPLPLEARDVIPPPPRTGSMPERAQDGGGASQGQERREPPAPQRGGGAEGSTPAVLAFTLRSPGLRTRGGNGSAGPLVIPRGVALVRLFVKVIPNEYEAYAVSLQKLGDTTEVLHQVVPRHVPAASGERLKIEVPASLLTNGDYILKVTSGNETLALHQLSVQHDPPRN